jgi:hypothetical protein
VVDRKFPPIALVTSDCEVQLMIWALIVMNRDGCYYQGEGRVQMLDRIIFRAIQTWQGVTYQLSGGAL